MPYISQDERGTFVALKRIPGTPGQLNYLLTTLCLAYLREHGISYMNINDIIGALECAKLEIYRRQVADYENKKMLENGDIPWIPTQ